MARLLADLRYGFRILFQNPGFAAVAVFSLALGIGANSTIFSVMNAVLFRPLPFQEPERLVMLWEVNLEQPSRERNPSIGTFLDWREQAESFEQMEMTVIYGHAETISGEGGAERVSSQHVTPSFFQLLGVKPELGRLFLSEDAPYDGGNVIISHRLWQRRFGADPNIVGKKLPLGRQVRKIVGVMPPRFWIVPWRNDVDLWIALNLRSNQLTADSRWLSAVARLKGGVKLIQAQAEMDTVAAQLAEGHPDTNRGWGIKIYPIEEVFFQGAQQMLLLLLGAVGFVLLISCTNVANMLLARAIARQKEMAIRSSLGATRMNLFRQLLIESLLLALAGGALGLLFAVWGIQLFVALAPSWYTGLGEISIDARVLNFTLAVSLVAGILFGLMPAFQSSKPDLTESLKEGIRRSTGRSRHRIRSALVVAEVALALVLFVGAGLMINTFLRLQRVDPGFYAEDVLTMEITLAGTKYLEFIGNDMKRVTPRVDIFHRELLERVAALPGVESVSTSSPLRHYGLRIGDRPNQDPSQQPRVGYCEVSPGYFATMEIPLLRGRSLSERDLNGTPWVVVINEAMARRYFPDEEALGQQLHVNFGGSIIGFDFEESQPREVVGVVGDVRHYGLRWEAQPTMYVSQSQQMVEFPGGGSELRVRKKLLIHAASDPMKLVAPIRKIIEELDKDQAVYDVQTMEHFLSDSIAYWRFWMQLLGIFAGLALILVVIGVYGVMSYSVRERTHEVGVRMAIGARPWDVLQLVIWQGFKLTAIGLLIGIGASFCLTRFISRYLYGVSPTDPLTIAIVCGVLVAVAMTACYIPGRWATKVNPVVALRYE